MLTPFLPGGEIDYPALDKLTDFYLEAGAGGLFANCLSSEMYELTGPERLSIVERIVRRANGAVPVVASGSFGHTLYEQAGFIKRVYDTGVQAVILISSLLATEDESDKTWEERVTQLLEMTEDIPVGFYECPVPYKRVISPKQLERFCVSGRIRYHKDTSLDIVQVTEKLRRTESSALELYDAYMVHALESLDAGAAGLSCIQGNFCPELVVWLCHHYQDPGLRTEIREVHQFFVDRMHVMHDVYPVVAKYFLKTRGVEISAFTRRQVGIYSQVTQKELEKLRAETTALEQRIEIPLVR